MKIWIAEVPGLVIQVFESEAGAVQWAKKLTPRLKAKVCIWQL